MTNPRRFAEVAEEIGTAEDIRRLGRLVRAEDTEDDRAHLRLLIVQVQELIDPGPPDELELTARRTIGAMRGTSLRTVRRA